MASGAHKWLLAVTASAIGQSLLVHNALTAVLATAGKVTVWVHWATVLTGFAHVSLLAVAGGSLLFDVEFTISVVATGSA